MRILLALCLLTSVARADDACQPDTFYLVGTIRPDIMPYFAAWLQGAKRPLVVIDSDGGSMAASIEINRLIAVKGGVRCRVKNVAASGAFGILQACAVREAESNATLVTHEPLSSWPGLLERKGAAAFLDRLVAISRDWNALCGKRLKLTAVEYEARVYGRDWSMNAREALAVGAVDVIVSAN